MKQSNVWRSLTSVRGMLTAALLLCTLPITVLIASRFLDWTLTWTVVGLVLVVEAALCWRLGEGLDRKPEEISREDR